MFHRRVHHVTPGLMIYDLHRNLSSDTDDTDYEPGVEKKEVSWKSGIATRKKKKKQISSSSTDSTTDEEPVKRKQVKKRKVSTLNKRKPRVRRKIRRFGDIERYSQQMSDSSDSDFDPSPDGNSKPNRTKKKEKQLLEAPLEVVEVVHPCPPSDQTWSILPSEILTKIFRYVCDGESKGVKYVCSCAQVCRHWNNTVVQPVSWRNADLAFMGGNEHAKNCLLDELVKTKFRDLESLSLSGWLYLTNVGIESIADHCSRLRSLNISHCQKKSIAKISGSSLVLLAEKCSLERINISNLRIPTAYAKSVINVIEICREKLTHLNFSGNIGLGSAVLTMIIKHCCELKSLDVSNTSVRSVSFSDFQDSCPKLEELYLANLFIEPKNSKHAKCGFKQMIVCSVAKRGAMSWLTDSILVNMLQESKLLTILDMRGNSNISQKGLELSSDRLERLYMSKCSLNEIMIKTICERWNKTLWDVDFSWTDIYDANFDDLIACLLTGLNVCTQIAHFDVSGTSISDSGVKIIVMVCHKLRSLNLTSCRGVSRGIKRHHVGIKQINKLRRFSFH